MTLTHPFAGWRLGPQHRTTRPLLPFQFTGAIVGTTYSEDSATATIADVVGTRVTVANGHLTLASGGTDGDPAFIGDTGATWAAGLAFIVKGSAAANAGVGLYIADTTTPINILSTAQGIGWYLLGTDDFVLRNGTQRADTPSPGTNWTLAIIARANGVFALVNGKLWWVFDSDPGYTAVYPHIVSSRNADTTLDGAVLTPIPNAQAALVTDALVGSVAAGDTFNHQHDCRIEWTQTSLADFTRIVFRFIDANNHWFALVRANGQFQLYERTGGSTSVRATGATNVQANDRLVVVVEGTTISGYINAVAQWHYTQATSHVTATLGKRNDDYSPELGGVENLRVYVRDVANDAPALWNAITGVIQ